MNYYYYIKNTKLVHYILLSYLKALLLPSIAPMTQLLLRHYHVTFRLANQSIQLNSIQFNFLQRTYPTLCRKARPKVCCVHKSMTYNLIRAFPHGVEYVLCRKSNRIESNRLIGKPGHFCPHTSLSLHLYLYLYFFVIYQFVTRFYLLLY